MPDDLKMLAAGFVIALFGVGGYIIGTALWDRFYGKRRSDDEDD